jgi:hypothetical protein
MQIVVQTIFEGEKDGFADVVRKIVEIFPRCCGGCGSAD